jgi:hypothetical protein
MEPISPAALRFVTGGYGLFEKPPAIKTMIARGIPAWKAEQLYKKYRDRFSE